MRRFFFIMLGMLVVLFVVNIWLSYELAKVRPVFQEKEMPLDVEAKENVFVKEDVPLLSNPEAVVAQKKAMITVIKPSAQKKPVPVIGKQIDNIDETFATKRALLTASSTAQKKGDSASSDRAASVTKVISTKHPTEIEAQDMNVRGILMW